MSVLSAGIPAALTAFALIGGVACTDAEPAADPTLPATSSPRSPSPEESAPSAEPSTPSPRSQPSFREFDVPAGARPHDVAPGADGVVWFTAQGSGHLGRLDPATGESRMIPLGGGSRPHGVIVGPGGVPWVTDGGLNAIVRVDPESLEVQRFPLPGGNANLNTAAFDGAGILWFTGQNGIYGRLNTNTGRVRVFGAPRGRGPYGIAATPDGTVWFSSLAGSYIARVDGGNDLTVVDVPTSGGGARRVWSDSTGRLWVTEWFAGKLARYDPGTQRWAEWDLPGRAPQPYAVFVDERDLVWVSDFGANALLRFDPARERFTSFRFPSAAAEVRQLLGRPGQVWGAGSNVDTLVVLRTG